MASPDASHDAPSDAPPGGRIGGPIGAPQGFPGGEPQRDAIGTPVVVVSRTGAVAADLNCRKCFSNLLGSSVNANCPDCGAPVGISVYGELLRYGRPVWVRRMSKGAGVAAWGILLGVAAAVAVATIPGTLGQWIGPSIGLAAALLLFRGGLQLTRGDPNGQVSVSSGGLRFAVRLALLVWLGSQALQLAPVAGPPEWQEQRWVQLAPLPAALVGVAGHFGLLHHLNLLGLRVPNAALSRRARFVRVGYVLALAGAVGLPSAVKFAPTYAGYAIIVALIMLVVYGVEFMVLLTKVQRACSIQADYAHGIASRARQGIA